jgi:Domain of unknown function (DUF4864)
MLLWGCPYMMRHPFIASLVALLGLCTFSRFALSDAVPGATQPAATDLPKPDPALGADAVIRIVMGALQQNDGQDHGIEETFRFASPGNKQATGPLEHFQQLVKSPEYAPMLHFKTVEYGKLHIDGDTAVEAVRIVDSTGASIVYIFQLSRQPDGQFKGCWMTDGVLRYPPTTQPAAPPTVQT